MVTFSRKKVNEMAKRTGGKTFVPQIFVDDQYFGGLAELISYYKENK
jgi:glutaredoxin